MNGVAHYLFGLLITLLVLHFMVSKEEGDRVFSPVTIAVIALVAFFSHMFVDALAHFTYHPSESNWSDPIYAGWHLTNYVAEAVFAIYALRVDIRYAIGMLASVGFDLWDWSLRRPLEKYGGVEGLPSIHWLADGTQNFLFGWAPSLRYEQWALLIEVVVVIALFFGWRAWHNSSVLREQPRPSSIKELVALILVFGTLRLLTLV